jgi:hypothetical protein
MLRAELVGEGAAETAAPIVQPATHDPDVRLDAESDAVKAFRCETDQMLGQLSVESDAVKAFRCETDQIVGGGEVMMSTTSAAASAISEIANIDSLVEGADKENAGVAVEIVTPTPAAAANFWGVKLSPKRESRSPLPKPRLATAEGISPKLRRTPPRERSGWTPPALGLSSVSPKKERRPLQASSSALRR